MSDTEKRSKGKDRIDLILTAAEDMITRNGFAKLNFSELAKELKLSRGTIYYYFENEQNLVAKIISNKMELLLVQLRKIPSGKNGLAELRFILKSFHGFLKEHTNYLNLISYFTAQKHKDFNEDSVKYHGEYEEKRNELFVLCHNSIEKGIKDSSIYPVAEPYQIAYMIWATVGSFWQYMMKDNVLQPVKNPGSNEVDKMMNIYFEMIYRALSNSAQEK
jgi:AcrR family transcriptional regulator